jgi:hypothetical protein
MRFVVVGMNNPQGNHALWTRPKGGTGHRLWELAAARTGVTQLQWLGMTDRRNLCQEEWDMEAARIQARVWTPELWSRVTVLLGAEVARCFPSTGLICQWAKPHGTPPRAAPPWVTIPHPSGMNRWYNDPINRAAVEILLGDVVEMCRERTAA